MSRIAISVHKVLHCALHNIIFINVINLLKLNDFSLFQQLLCTDFHGRGSAVS